MTSPINRFMNTQNAYRYIQRKLFNPSLGTIRKLQGKQRFFIKDNGSNNIINVAKNNKIIGKSLIVIRKGNGNQVNIAGDGKFKDLNIAINGNNNRVIIGKNVKYSGQLLIVGQSLTIEIGNETTAIGCYILARDKSVYIGEQCMISRGVEIRATDVHSVIDITTDERINPATEDVHIGNKVWIAADVTVSKNVTISDGCVIAAKSFVNKSVLVPNSMVAGTPAKIIRSNVRWVR